MKKITSTCLILLALLCLTWMPSRTVQSQSSQNVTWVFNTNTSSCGTGCVQYGGSGYYAMATSTETIPATGGYFEWTYDGKKPVIVGLTPVSPAPNPTPQANGGYSDLFCAVETWDGTIGTIREGSQYRGDVTSFASNPRFRIEIASNQVIFKKNGVTISTSPTVQVASGQTYKLVFKTQNEFGNTPSISNATYSGSQAPTPTPTPPPCQPSAPSGSGSTTWVFNTNTSSCGTGCVQYGGSGYYAMATSTETIPATGGYFEWTYDGKKPVIVGLTPVSPAPNPTPQANGGYSDLFCAVETWDGTIGTIREGSQYRGDVTSFASNPRFRIEIASNQVIFKKNGVTISTSPTVQVASGQTYKLVFKTQNEFGNTPSISNATYSGGQAAGPAGLIDDNAIKIPGNYTTWTPPVKGCSYVDPTFSTVITRLSNGTVDFGAAVRNEYATMSPFNKDSTRILVATPSGGFFIVDRSGATIVDPATLSLSESAEPRWSVTDANIFYFREGNQFRKYDLSQPVNLRKTTLRTFSQYTEIRFGGGDTDISEDGQHIGIVGTENNIHPYAFVYNFITDTSFTRLDLLCPVSTACPPSGDWNRVEVTPNNNVLIRWDLNGTSRAQGYELYNKNMQFTRQVSYFGGHADSARDSNGDEVLLIVNYNANEYATGCNPGLEKIRLTDSTRSCLVPLYWNSVAHVGGNSPQSPWALVSVSDERDPGTASLPATLPSNWQQQWGVRFNEVLMVNVFTGERRRLAHHRSRINGGYWWQPRAAISRDGAWAVYTNSFAQPSDYTDAFLLKLTQ